MNCLTFFKGLPIGPVDPAPKLAPVGAEREGLVSNLYISQQVLNMNNKVQINKTKEKTHQKSILKPGLKRC